MASFLLVVGGGGGGVAEAAVLTPGGEKGGGDGKRAFRSEIIIKKRDFSGPTRDVHVHDAGAGPDAVGGVAHVRAGQVEGHGALEEQRVVPDLHVGGQGAVQAAAGEVKKMMNEKRS